MANIFTMSDGGNSEYCCNIVRVGEIKPIEGSDFLGRTIINGQSIVVRKDQVHEGNVFFYASNECQLNEKFLSVNNLFDISSYELNSNSAEVKKLLDSSNNTFDAAEREKFRKEAKKKVGLFNKHGRVRMIRLRKVPSYGFLFSIDEMAKYCPKVKEVKLDEYINKDFDTVDGELFVKAYIPFVPEKENTNNLKRYRKAQKRIDRFDRMVSGEFVLHYKTELLGKNMWRITPNTVVTITNKLHGTSAIFSRVKTRVPIKLPFYKKIWNRFVDTNGMFTKARITDYRIDYGNVYSSRTVIKNKYINNGVNEGFYGTDVWAEYNELLKDKIPDGMTVYGEIIGYLSGSDKMIQKQYDYGCEVGRNKFMPYRITSSFEDGTKYEWNVIEVEEWTEKLIKDYPEIKDRIEFIHILYHGTLGNLYPDIDVSNHWHENVLEALKNDKECFGMELDEPLCKNKVPREGIVLRIHGDKHAEAFKLKTDAFYGKEQKEIDAGNVDMEMQDTFCEN